MVLVRTPPTGQPKPSEITPESIYRNRRSFLRDCITVGSGALLAPALAQGKHQVHDRTLGGLSYREATPEQAHQGFFSDEKLTPYHDATHYNNYYEFGTRKSDPAMYARQLPVEPWSVKVEGEAERSGVFPLEDLLKGLDLEERIYRLRCVEAWSMVLPWIGFPLGDLLKRFQPTSDARYVAFRTVHDRAHMRGQRSIASVYDWPYREGLRIDEAMHPLTILAVGLYGKQLPNQNGAPLRLVVPWKYGFKSIKSIVGIRFQKRQPRTTWTKLSPREYGFYSNVNPKVNHPRWSQAHERRLPSPLFGARRIATRMFNGYGEQVASLYAGMDLRRFY